MIIGSTDAIAAGAATPDVAATARMAAEMSVRIQRIPFRQGAKGMFRVANGGPNAHSR
jgi:hypothetical protein